jgi:single-strand DNA-binding protein
MAGTLNKVQFIGNLTRDPEIRYIENTRAVTKFTLAVNRKTKQSDETLYIDIVAWEQRAEFANTYLKKGMSVYTEGRLVIRAYDDKDGNKRRAIEVVASDVQILDKKAPGEANGSPKNGATNGASHEADEDPVFDEVPF